MNGAEIWRTNKTGSQKLIRSHKPFHELIFAFSASLQPTLQTEHGNEVTQGLKHQNTGLFCYSRKQRLWLWFSECSHRGCKKMWSAQSSPCRDTPEDTYSIFVKRKSDEECFRKHNWVILPVILMCHEAVFHVSSLLSFFTSLLLMNTTCG